MRGGGALARQLFLQHFEHIIPSHLEDKVSAEKSAGSLMVVPLYVWNFLLLLLLVFKFSVFDFIIVCLGEDIFGDL